MSRTLVSAVAALGVLTGSALAQEAPKAGGEERPAAGAEGGELKLPPGQAKPPGKVPGAAGGGASQGMKPNAGEAAKPEPGARKQGENAGVEPKAGQAAPGQPKPGQPEPKPTAQKTGQPAGEAGKSAGSPRPAPPLSSEQRTRVVQTFSRVNVRPINVNFNVNVGVVIPRTIVLEPLPPEVITIVPAYESYQFFAVPGEIVIVDPITLAIIAILPL